MVTFTVSLFSQDNFKMLMDLALILYNDQQRKTCEVIINRMVKRAIEMEGTVSGEHGVGLGKRDYLNDELGKTTVDAMRKVSSWKANFNTLPHSSQLKIAFDPLCLLNCDKVIRMEKPTSREVAA